MKSIHVDELKTLLDQLEDLVLVDVREPWEYAICHIKGSRHIPVSQFMQQWHTLPRDKTIAVICHHGVRSLQIAYFLKSKGFQSILNISGGIDHWAQVIDPNMATY